MSEIQKDLNDEDDSWLSRCFGDDDDDDDDDDNDDDDDGDDDDSWLGRCFACRRHSDAKTRRVFTNFLNLQRTLSLNRRRPKIH